MAAEEQKSMRTNQEYLRSEQYAGAGNLNARIALHSLFTTNRYGWFRWVFDHLEGLPKEARLLELGSGSCRLWAESMERIPPGWTITLSDFSPGMLVDGQKALGESSGRFNFEIVDAQSIPFPEATFDAVIANHMLYHVPDRPSAFANIQRVLKPGGTLFAATNGAKHMLETYTLGRKAHPILAQAAQELISHNQFTLENGAEQLNPWFEVVAVNRYDDSLEVTEVEPLVDYLLSMAVFNKLPLGREELRTVLGKIIGAEIEQKGKIHIQKSTGMFIARKKVEL